MNELEIQKPFSLIPGTLTEAMEYAKLISDSDLCPKDFKGKPGSILVAVQLGMEIGLKPLQAIQNIAVINGRATLWGDAMLALVRAHPSFDGILEEQSDAEATCTVKRKGEPETVRTFSMEDAKKAGLASKDGPWRLYPKRMMQMRARGFALRDAFTDVLKGLIIAEEAQDYIDSEAAEVPKSGLGMLVQRAAEMRAEKAHIPQSSSMPDLSQEEDVKLRDPLAPDHRQPSIVELLNGCLSLSSLQHAFFQLTKEQQRAHVNVKDAVKKRLEKAGEKWPTTT